MSLQIITFVSSENEKRTHRKQIESRHSKTVETIQHLLQYSNFECTLSNMTNLSEIVAELQTALAEAEKAEKQLEEARAKLKPLIDTAESKRNAVHVLMNQYQGLTMGDSAPFGKRGRSRKAPGEPKRTYNVTPESKVAATIKRQTTRALNAGKSQKEAEATGKAAGKALAQKLGMK